MADSKTGESYRHLSPMLMSSTTRATSTIRRMSSTTWPRRSTTISGARPSSSWAKFPPRSSPCGRTPSFSCSTPPPRRSIYPSLSSRDALSDMANVRPIPLKTSTGTSFPCFSAGFCARISHGVLCWEVPTTNRIQLALGPRQRRLDSLVRLPAPEIASTRPHWPIKHSLRLLPASRPTPTKCNGCSIEVSRSATWPPPTSSRLSGFSSPAHTWNELDDGCWPLSVPVADPA